MSKSMLITGGAGFIGANFVMHWLKHYPQHQITVLDALTYAGNKATLTELIESDQISFYQGDIGDQHLLKQILQKHKIKTIVNFAAESHVDRSISGPSAFVETNVLGTQKLLESAKDYWLANQIDDHWFHHISTDEVYGTLAANHAPFTEQHQYLPNSPYAASKAASDHLIRAYHETYGLRTSISNCSNNFGPYHFPEKLIPLVITNILFDKPIPVYGDGKQIRDWLFVRDHCRAIELILNNAAPGSTYNIGGNNEQYNLDIVHLICASLNQKFKAEPALANHFPQAHKAIEGHCEQLITHVVDRLGHDRRYAVDASKAESELGYKAHGDFAQLLEETIDWYLANSDWWQPLLQKAKL